jgi:hypothetical protein
MPITFINLDKPYPIFTIVIWGSERPKFGGDLQREAGFFQPVLAAELPRGFNRSIRAPLCESFADGLAIRGAG